VTAPASHRGVRLAWPADAGRIGAIQAAAWRAEYATLLPVEVLADVDADAYAARWAAAVDRPPSARHRVLVALDGGAVVGFAALAPSPDPDAHPGRDAELVALHVDPAATRRGHGSRLVAAAADTARADRFGALRTWLLAGDDALRGFLAGAGWAPDGASRELDLTGDGSVTVRQVRLHTALGDDGAHAAGTGPGQDRRP
jgi:GNAT superfamily N-acetyltransferase